MLRNRVIKLLSFFIIGLIILLARLAEIQLFQTESFSSRNINLLAESVKQRSHEIIIHDGRGDILASNGESLVYESAPTLILFPFLNKTNWPVSKVAKILNVKEAELVQSIDEKTKPVVLGGENPIVLSNYEKKAINELAVPGVIVVDKQLKIGNNVAEQLVGITGENPELFAKRYEDRKQKTTKKNRLGLTGLQASFDEFLLADAEEKLVYHVDAIGDPLFGVDIKYVNDDNPFFPVNVQTTVNIEIQKIAERLVNEHNIKKGGLILLDIKNNNILANVSRPTIDKSNPYASKGTNNLMFQRQIAGSIFKTIIAAAAIDYKLVDDRLFDCSRKINGEREKKYDYGMLNFTDSFARSCNNTFGELSKELMKIDPNIIETYAEKLSVNDKVGWNGQLFNVKSFKQLHGEESGRVFLKEEDKIDENYVALSAIGQHEVRITPLAVASMMATIAKGGKKEMIKAVSAINYKNDSVMTSFKDQIIPGETLSPYTAMELQRLLREVVINEQGTGRNYRNLPFEVAGKSGTAQTGIFSDDGELYNKWFAGFFPFKDPKYALVVVNLDVLGNEGGVNELFANVVKELYSLTKAEQI